MRFTHLSILFFFLTLSPLTLTHPIDTNTNPISNLDATNNIKPATGVGAAGSITPSGPSSQTDDGKNVIANGLANLSANGVANAANTQGSPKSPTDDNMTNPSSIGAQTGGNSGAKPHENSGGKESGQVQVDTANDAIRESAARMDAMIDGIRRVAPRTEVVVSRRA